ncbi:HIRAN domain-containing protein [Proteus mirabilis]|uniref:HIRAN domain-containing protein n=1 Tax=Proteus mirabilis TaxID=584 RepID=UPI0021BF444B|nr:HIRAN domain-containing protein [Proteus mirabilis]MCT9019356.1 HIRAN domain-containing protein [Proteus mirabilis]
MDIKLIDVTNWRKDDEHAIFPRGARDKKMLWSPTDASGGIKPDWPYLFKLSREAFPDQYWMETVAYIIGNMIGVPVPKALPARIAMENGEYEYGALLEWFYDIKSHKFIHASDFFHDLITDFDDSSGKHHNLGDLRLICRKFSIHSIISTNWTLWLHDMLLFDAFIGNSDRHQENWGFVFVPETIGNSGSPKVKGYLAPYFDNGTSLGHERYTEKIAGWSNQNIDDYIQRGCHHLRKNRNDTRERLGHISSIQNLVLDEQVRTYLAQKFAFDFSELVNRINSLCEISSNVPFTRERAYWTIRLLRRRYLRLSLILNMRTISRIIEPTRLLLTWQPTTGGTRYVVGQIDRQQEDTYTFTYHFNSPNYTEAETKGFKGHPAFSLKNEKHTNSVLDPFVRRLPPRKRGDFAEYLAQHLLPHPFEGSDFALLGYTGAKSPGDGFCLVLDPEIFRGEGEFLFEVAGTRYQEDLDLSNVMVGDLVKLVPEPDNQFDPHAIAVMHESGKLGYINKVVCKELNKKIAKRKVSAFVAKKNGTAERPLVYLIVECSA